MMPISTVKIRHWPFFLGVQKTAPLREVVRERTVRHEYGVDEPQFLRELSAVVGVPMMQGNSVTELLNGDETFPCMLDAIRQAQSTITFESYIHWPGKVGRMFAQALAERARAGVKVHVVIDAVGSYKLDQQTLDIMQNAGIEVEIFNPLFWAPLEILNNRSHRKILVVDGKIGFTGGICIADEWSGDADSMDHWRDTHYRLEGPAVAQLQGAFVDSWLKASKKLLQGANYFPQIESVGPLTAQVIHGSPKGHSQDIRHLYLMSIASARRSIRLSASYFVPDEETEHMLIDACRRGVLVEIIAPGKQIDFGFVRRASRAQWGRLYEAGVHFFEYQKTMYHCKVMIVDDVWVSVGSTNFDHRSFFLNDEVNLNVHNAKFAARQLEIFESDKADSREIPFQEWKNRPWIEKLQDHAASLIRSQL